MTTEAITPYAGTSGFSGSSTSEDRARTQDADGTTSARQQQVLRIVRDQRLWGITVKTLREEFGLHHGQASSALTVLHKAGLIQRLSETRDRCKVYVSTEHVNGREIEPPGRTRGTEQVLEVERQRILTLIFEAEEKGYRYLSTDEVRQMIHP